jgi:crotonobetainyl-CoA:carnitine CoA-transferase CaiB-like acyl-CoA transferase
MAQAFAGLRVLDLTTTIAGPHCARLLADLGADVVKVESPEGDVMRTRPPLRGGASSYFGQLNAGKRSVVLDLKDERAVAAVRRIAERADILVENYRPGVTRRLGLDYAKLSAGNPRLIYCSISGYGQTGPSADLAAYAPVIHATSGYDLAHLAYQRGRTRPDNCGLYVADVMAGTYAFGAIATALHQRHTTGKGQHLDISMFESMLSLTQTEIQTAQFEVPPPPARPIFGPVATADGFINIAVVSERTFQSMAAAAGRPDWVADPRFAKYLDRRGNWGELMDEFEVWSKQLSCADCLAVLDRHSVPAAAYRTVRQAMEDPQLAHRGAFREVRDAGGPFKALNPPFRMSGAATEVGPRVPGLGEHTAEVLSAVGFSAGEIAALTGATGAAAVGSDPPAPTARKKKARPRV